MKMDFCPKDTEMLPLTKPDHHQSEIVMDFDEHVLETQKGMDFPMVEMLDDTDSSKETESLSNLSSSGVDENLERGNWSNKLDFFLSLLGYSVGLSNIWRFPYLCYKNGGGAFLIPYWICMFLCGVPLFFLEVSIGQFTSRSGVSMWSLNPLFKGAGLASIVITLVTTTYFQVLMSYTVFFFVQSFVTKDGQVPWYSCGNSWNTANCLDYNNDTVYGQYQDYQLWKKNSSHLEGSQYQEMFNKTLRSPSDEYFHNRVLKISSGMENIGGFVPELIACMIPVWLITGLCLIKGVKSVGKVVYFTATFPYVVLTVLLVRGLTLPGAWEGIEFYIKPNFTILQHGEVWSDAAFQVFFSLGPGWGGLITLGSYNKFNNNCYKDSLLVPILMGLTSFFAGFVVFSVVGFMAAVTGNPVSEVVEKGPGLAFIMYPEVVTKLPLSQFWSALFFFMLFIVGLDSVFVMIETSTAAIWDELPNHMKIPRHWILLVACILMCIMGLPFATNGGIYILTLVDTYNAIYTVMIVCMMEVLGVAWIYGGEKFLYDVSFMVGYRPPMFWSFCWRFITFGIILCIFVVSCAQYDVGGMMYGHYTFPPWTAAWGWAVASLSLSTIPIWMIYTITKTEGDTLLQKVSKALKPRSDWGPALSDYKQDWIMFRKQEIGYNWSLYRRFIRFFKRN